MTLSHQSTLRRRLTIPRTASQMTGLMSRVSLTQRPPSPRTGMRTRHSRSPTRRLLSLKTGSMTSLPPFPTLRPRSLKTGMTRKMVTGFPRPSPTPSVRRPPVVAFGSDPLCATQSTRANGPQNSLTTQPTRASGHQERSQTLIIMRTRPQPNSSPWAL